MWDRINYSVFPSKSLLSCCGYEYSGRLMVMNDSFTGSAFSYANDSEWFVQTEKRNGCFINDERVVTWCIVPQLRATFFSNSCWTKNCPATFFSEWFTHPTRPRAYWMATPGTRIPGNLLANPSISTYHSQTSTNLVKTNKPPITTSPPIHPWDHSRHLTGGKKRSTTCTPRRCRRINLLRRIHPTLPLSFKLARRLSAPT